MWQSDSAILLKSPNDPHDATCISYPCATVPHPCLSCLDVFKALMVSTALPMAQGWVWWVSLWVGGDSGDALMFVAGLTFKTFEMILNTYELEFDSWFGRTDPTSRFSLSEELIIWSFHSHQVTQVAGSPCKGSTHQLPDVTWCNIKFT